jgi:hypothetical protein
MPFGFPAPRHRGNPGDERQGQRHRPAAVIENGSEHQQQNLAQKTSRPWYGMAFAR